MSRIIKIVLAICIVLIGAQPNAAQTVQQYKLFGNVSLADDQFGAVGDGVTDDTAAVQAALDYIVAQGGGILTVPAKTFILTDTVVAADTSFIQIHGAGVDSELKQTGEGKDCIRFDNCEWGTIRDLTIRGDPETGVGLRMNDTSSNWYFDHVWFFQNGSHGFQVTNTGVGYTFIACEFRANGGSGFHAVDTNLHSNGNATNIFAGRCMFNASDGVVFNADQLNVFGLISEHNRGAAIHIDASSEGGTRQVDISRVYSEGDDLGFVKMSSRAAADIISNVHILRNIVVHTDTSAATASIYADGTGSAEIRAVDIGWNDITLGGSFVDYVDMNDHARGVRILEDFGDETTFVNLGTDFQIGHVFNNEFKTNTADSPGIRIQTLDDDTTNKLIELLDSNGDQIWFVNANGSFSARRNTTITAGGTGGFNIAGVTSGNMANDFGPQIFWQIQDNAGVLNTIGYISATRDGADNTGRFIFAPYNAGSAEARASVDRFGLSVGSTLTATANSNATLTLSINTAGDPTLASNTAGVYAKDIGGTNTTPFAKDETGNVRPIVPYQDTVTLGVGVTTFAVPAPMMEVTGDGGGNTISTITGAQSFAGATVTLLFVDANVTITDDNSHTADTVDLSAAFTSADDTTLTLIHNGTSWYEISRSVN